VLPLVPAADVRIIAVKDDVPVADVTTTIGITYTFAGGFWAGLTIVTVFVLLAIVARSRLQDPGIKRANRLLRIIYRPNGRASLSQFQIVLWTLVVAASAVYVMALSGELIEITNGTLVLLGIAGGATLGAKAHGEMQNSAAQAAAATAGRDADKRTIEAAEKSAAALAAATDAKAAAEQQLAAKAAADAKRKAQAAQAIAKACNQPPDGQEPRWSDLIVNETTITNADGTVTVTREIDVTRFQMLLFTVITAAFVVMNVATTYVIPEIPTGFVTLMGISNGVYLGAKVAQSPAA
jgi:hypothetical protein